MVYLGVGVAPYIVDKRDVEAAAFQPLSQIERTTSVRGSRSTLRLSKDLVRRIDQRTLFILGDSDPFGGPLVGRRAVEVMLNARFETVSGGHLPFLDEPELCASHLSEFSNE